MSPYRPHGLQGRRTSVVIDKDANNQIRELKAFYHLELGVPLAVSGIIRRALAHLSAHVQVISATPQADYLLVEKSLAGGYMKPKRLKKCWTEAPHKPFGGLRIERGQSHG